MYKIGDKVKLKESSQYYGQFEGVGVVVRIIKQDRLPYKVESGNYSNAYSDEDLELVEPFRIYHPKFYKP